MAYEARSVAWGSWGSWGALDIVCCTARVSLPVGGSLWLANCDCDCAWTCPVVQLDGGADGRTAAACVMRSVKGTGDDKAWGLTGDTARNDASNICPTAIGVMKLS
jgi:hypothetical protein